MRICRRPPRLISSRRNPGAEDESRGDQERISPEVGGRESGQGGDSPSLRRRLRADSIPGWVSPRQPCEGCEGGAVLSLDEQLDRHEGSARGGRAGGAAATGEGSSGEKTGAEFKPEVETQRESEEILQQWREEKEEEKEEERLRADGKKALDSLFRDTGLDPRWKIRKRFKKMGRKAASRKTKKSETSSSSSTSSSSGGSLDREDLFGEELRVKKVWKRYPGVLASSLVETMQEALLSTTGQLWEVNKEQLPPILSQYWKQHLAPRMTGPMRRESQTLAYLGDLLLQGQAAGALDVVGQRLKALEQSSQGVHFTVAQKIELVPQELTQITSNVETLEAGKVTREDAKARQVGNRLWNSKGEEQKGKGKGKSEGKNLALKGKGKGRGQGHQEENWNQQKNEDKGKKR